MGLLLLLAIKRSRSFFVSNTHLTDEYKLEVVDNIPTSAALVSIYLPIENFYIENKWIIDDMLLTVSNLYGLNFCY